MMKKYIEQFLREKPFFFSILRPKEADLYQQYKPFKKPVLDVGCGDGFFAAVAFGRIDVGIDIDKKALDEAKKRNVYKKIQLYDGHVFPYPKEFFPTVVCNSTFEHIPNIDEVLQEVSRVTKKKGMVYFTVPTNLWPKYLFGKFIGGKLYEKYFINKSKHYNLYSLKEWEQKLKKLGFEILFATHYLDNVKIMWLFDISHYLSISSLITKKLCNRWVLFPQKTKMLRPVQEFLFQQTKDNTIKGPYLFIAAKKI